MTISMTVSNGVCTMSKSITISSIGSIESISLWLSISLTLGNMDNTSRVGNISASTSIGTMDSMDSMVDRGNMMGSIANMSYTIAEMMPSNAIQSISISSSKSCSTSQQSYPDHVV